MFSVRIPPVLAGATALALLMGSAAVAQQQMTGQQGQAQDTAAQQDQTQGAAGQQGQAPAPAQGQAQGQAQPADQLQATGSGSAPQSGQMQQSFAQARQLLEQAQRSMQQDDPDTAMDAVEQANRLLQEPPGDVDEQQFLQLQAQLQQARDALENGDMEAAQAAIDEANAALQSVQQASEQAGSQQATSQQAMSQQPASQQQGSSQATFQQSGQQASMQQGGQMSQDALMQLRDHLEMARLDLQSAMDSVEQASRALDNLQPGMASAGSNSLDVTVIRGDAAQSGTQSEQPQQGTGVAAVDREVPRLSPEETQRLLGIGDRQIGEASERVSVSVADLEDRNVVSYEGERIGEIGNVINNGGQAVAIIEHGGFLGIGENRVAVPLDRLGMRGDDLVLLGLTEEQMKALPDYDFESGEEMSSEDAIEIGRYE